MTQHLLTEKEAHPRSLPVVFDYLAVFLALQSHLLALFQILSTPARYTSTGLALLLLGGSLAIPLVCVAAARRAGGGLSNRAFVTAGCSLVMIEIAQLLVLPWSDQGSEAAFTWGTTGVSILICAAYRPAADVLRLSGAVSATAVVIVLPAVLFSGVPAFRLLATLSATVIPALAAAEYLNQYVQARRRHADMVAQNASVTAQAMTASLVRQDSERRLESVSAELLPMLRAVASGQLAPDDPRLAADARRLSDALRRELLETHSGRWLLDARIAGAQLSDGSDAAQDDWPGAIVLDPESQLADLFDSDRVTVSVLLGVLRAHRGWQHVSVALASDVGPGPDVAGVPDVAGAAALTIVATGPASADAAKDAVIRSTSARLGATIDLEEQSLVIEAALRTVPWPVSRISLP